MKSNNLVYASIFRVAIGIILLIDTVTSIFFVNDIYLMDNYANYIIDDVLWLTFLQDHIYYFLSVYVFLLLLWICGIGKHFTSLMVFIFFCVDIYLISPGSFWGDTVLRTTLFLFVFVNSFYYLSINKSRQSIKLLHRLALWSILFHVCFMYSINVFHKLQNVEWVSGYALVYFFKFSKVNDIFNIGELLHFNDKFIQILSWTILFFQLTFPIFIWFKKWKWWWMLFGTITHTVMAFILQVYKFELIIILHYGFFVTDMEWKIFFKKIKLLTL